MLQGVIEAFAQLLVILLPKMGAILMAIKPYYAMGFINVCHTVNHSVKVRIKSLMVWVQCCIYRNGGHP